MGKKVLAKRNDQKERNRPHEEAAGSGGKRRGGQREVSHQAKYSIMQ